MKNKFILKDGANPNYLATICRIGPVYPIEGADRLVKTTVNNYDIVISKDYKEGDIVVYFPVESVICAKYLSANNLYEITEFENNSNADEVKEILVNAEALADDDVEGKTELLAQAKSKCGFFSKKGRVRILKLRGTYSMGFIAGIDSLVKYDASLADTNWDEMVGKQFNYIGDDEFCWKYVPVTNEPKNSNTVGGQSLWKKRMKHLKKFDRIIDSQFAFHYDTKMLVEHIKELSPDDNVSITVKIHGTSIIMANILCNKKLTIWDKVKKFFGANVATTEYGNVYSSRSVIKNKYINPSANSFYESDIYGCVNRDFSKYIPEGMTVYGEVVGYLEGSSAMIQKNHDYGCKTGEWKLMPYRITMTDKDGNKEEWNIDKVDEWTRNLVAEHPELEKKVLFLTILHYGRFGDFYPDLDETNHWHENVITRIKNDKEKILMELDEPLCTYHKVPREGIVIRKIDDPLARAWKIKSLRHYGKEAEQHDKGETDIEETA